MVLRAAAGDCIEVTLRNALPGDLDGNGLLDDVPDLAGFNTLLQMVNRDRNDLQGLTTFNNNLIRPSSHVGLHPQLVTLDVTSDDGVNVGINPPQTVEPGSQRTYRWYAGDVSITPDQKRDNGQPLQGRRHTGGVRWLQSDACRQGQAGPEGAGGRHGD